MSAPTPILLRNGTALIHDADDHITRRPNTDILLKDNIIVEIGTGLTNLPPDTKIIDCTTKIISPGFIDTHHHVWQTQLKGRHADEGLLQYMTSGNMQGYNYTPHDIFYGQLSGLLEALDSGTTTILDHHHGSYTTAHASQALRATLTSGLRTIFALSPPTACSTWTHDTCTLDTTDHLTTWILPFLTTHATNHPLLDRVHVALAFDLYYLPKPTIQSIFTTARTLPLKLITSHVAKNPIFGQHSTTTLLQSYNLLGPDILLSHATNLTAAEYKVLYDSGVSISSTPEIEAQMAMGLPVAFRDDVHGSLGVDCHSCNSASVLHQARVGLQLVRNRDGGKLLERGEYPKSLVGSVEKAFNLATVKGARALGMGEETGRIKVGMRADLVVFGTESTGMCCAAEFDALVAVVRHSERSDVEMVVVDGVVRKEGGRLCDVEVDGELMSWGDVRRETVESQKEVLRRVKGCSLEKARETLVGMWGIDETKLVAGQ